MSLWRVFTANGGRQQSHLPAFGAGALLFLAVYYLSRRRLHRLWYYVSTLEHELTHALVGLCFGKIPVSLRATAYEGGAVVFRNGSNVWIRLAPYYFPTLSLLLLLINYLLWQSASAAFEMALGATAAFHLLTTWQETSLRQPDLQESGWLASLLILPVMNLLCYGTIISFVAAGMAGVKHFWVGGCQHSGTALRQVVAILFGG